jgi:glucose/arabinose dehydrogenase/mono/diheme cytochrome c family protein
MVSWYNHLCLIFKSFFMKCNCAYFILFLCFHFTTFGQQKSVSSAQLSLGKTIFNSQCISCHNFRQKGIGPNLANLFTQTNKAWVTEFIKNPAAMQKKGDKRTLALIKEFKQLMPSYNLSPAKIDAVVAYIESQQRAKTKAISPAGLKDVIVPKIVKTGERLVLEHIQTAPFTSDAIPVARVNTMVTLNGGNKPRVFLSDLRGILYNFEETYLTEYLDMNKLNPNFIHTPGLASGLGSYAFHPDFYENGLFYTSHTEKTDSGKADFTYKEGLPIGLQWVVTEWKVNDMHADVFQGTPREMLRINMVTQIHGVQEITFNPHAKKGQADYGLLYIGVGDGGASENGFPFICENNTTVWSSVLRIDPQGRNSKNKKYGIPAANPYARDGNAKTAGEVYCRGFRNPNRIYWTPDGKMLISDIGHKNVEELNIGVKGGDYGWPRREGTFVIKPEANMDQVFKLPAKEKKYRYPAIQYDHDEGNAISSGFVYTGDDIPAMNNKYLFGDVVNGRVFYVENKELLIGKRAKIKELTIEVNGEVVNFMDICANPKTDLRFGMGLNNTLYLYTKTDGKIYKVVGLK